MNEDPNLSLLPMRPTEEMLDGIYGVARQDAKEIWEAMVYAYLMSKHQKALAERGPVQ